jgi:UDP-N-acetyl-D-glucosamine dehydrogenase
MPYHVVNEVADGLNAHKKALNGASVLVLGVAYKKDIDDLRESPAITIIELLHKAGANVSYHDPFIPLIGRGRRYDLQMKSVALDKLGQYDCVLILTDHSGVDYARVVNESQLVIDTRNATRNLKSSNVVYC